MTITVDATFENGQLKPTEPIALPEGTPVRLTITPKQDTADNKDPLAGLIGMFSSGRTDGAENHDKYLYGKRP